ncbi:MAG: hypothetical protein Q8L85_05705 [Alphaproteobacteria bacterium]|nr:hypothetical protein [Alphaproteobacteria bacterium]
MPKISTDNCFTLEIFGSKSDQRSSAKNGSFRLFGYNQLNQQSSFV